jgi:hypothetical protein
MTSPTDSFLSRSNSTMLSSTLSTSELVSMALMAALSGERFMEYVLLIENPAKLLKFFYY